MSATLHTAASDSEDSVTLQLESHFFKEECPESEGQRRTLAMAAASLGLALWKLIIRILRYHYNLHPASSSYSNLQSTGMHFGLPQTQIQKALDCFTVPMFLRSFSDLSAAKAVRQRQRQHKNLSRPPKTKNKLPPRLAFTNVAHVRRIRTVVQLYLELLLDQGHLDRARLIADGFVGIDIYMDGKSSGMAGLSGSVLLVALHFYQCCSPQSLRALLPVGIAVGRDGSRARREAIFTHLQLKCMVRALRGLSIRLKGSAADLEILPVKMGFKSDYKEFVGISNADAANARYPRPPPPSKKTADKAPRKKPDWVPNEANQWFTGQLCMWCHSAPFRRLRQHFLPPLLQLYVHLLHMLEDRRQTVSDSLRNGLLDLRPHILNFVIDRSLLGGGKLGGESLHTRPQRKDHFYQRCNLPYRSAAALGCQGNVSGRSNEGSGALHRDLSTLRCLVRQAAAPLADRPRKADEGAVIVAAGEAAPHSGCFRTPAVGKIGKI